MNKINIKNALSSGKLIGVYTDMCPFFDKNICSVEKNKREFIDNLNAWRNSGINLITLGLQSPNPFDEYYKKAREQNKTKDISFRSSAIKPDGSLDYDFLANSEDIINAADKLDFAVLVNILSPSCENIFEDEFAIINGVFNITDWLLEKNFSNIFVNITDVSHTFYKSSVLENGRIIKILKSVREKAKDNIILGAGIKSFNNIIEKNICEYINYSDFIPIYSNSAVSAKSNQNTKKMIENIYFFRRITREQGREDDVPIIMAKGDNLDEKHNSYGKNNLLEAQENNISWCYYDRENFIILPVKWNMNLKI